jgi:hypothetical protein
VSLSQPLTHSDWANDACRICFKKLNIICLCCANQLYFFIHKVCFLFFVLHEFKKKTYFFIPEKPITAKNSGKVKNSILTTKISEFSRGVPSKEVRYRSDARTLALCDITKSYGDHDSDQT